MYFKLMLTLLVILEAALAAAMWDLARPDPTVGRYTQVADARLDARVTDLRLDGAALVEAVEALQAHSGANIVVRWADLHEEDHAPARIRLHLRDVPLATALDAVLAQVPATSRLTWTVHDGIIYVTDDVYVRDAESVRFYGVRDFGGPGELVRLRELLTERVAPDSWRENGGTGAIYEFNGVLAVVQTERAHRQIANLLDALRRARSSNGVVGQN